MQAGRAMLGVASVLLPWLTFAASTSVQNDSKAALAAVQLLLDGWREADAAKLEIALHPSFREVTLHGMKQSADHCGIANFQLYRIDTQWKIVNFAETHSDQC
jgi:hypothetical protein